MYQIEIADLNAKINVLEANNSRKKMSPLFSSESTCLENIPRPESKTIRRSNSKSLNRSQSKQNLFSKQKNNNKITSQLSVQTKIYRKMLLVNSLWDSEFINDFEELMRVQTSDIESIVQNLQELDTQFESSFATNWGNNRKFNVFTRFQELQDLIKKQSQVISDMKIYQTQLENIIKGLTQKLNNFYDENTYPNRLKKWNSTYMTQTNNQIMEALRKWKLRTHNREKRMEEENKEMRQIVEEMILLINKKKQASSKDSGKRII